MRLARFSLAATSFAFFVFGCWLLVQPEGVAGLGIHLPSDTAKVEIRSMYGGFEIGLGIFFLLAVMRSSWHRPALMLQAIALASLGSTRLITTLLASNPHPLLYWFAALELAAALIGGIAYQRLGTYRRAGDAITPRPAGETL
jgi:hypothetical protein